MLMSAEGATQSQGSINRKCCMFNEFRVPRLRRSFLTIC